ncbi:MAG: quinoprotein dehydrogenase-associated SoxYZ-like carrier [Pseudolabrys sp.]
MGANALRATRIFSTFVTAFVLAVAAGQAHARTAWNNIRSFAVGTRPIMDGKGVFTFKAPYRAMDQRRVPLSVKAAFHDGRTIKSITFVVDEDPMPIAATFRFADDRARANIGFDIRLDHASPVHAIVEASDGKLYMSEHFVKASGLGVCAAPPIDNEAVALRTMGRMHLADITGGDGAANATHFRRRAAPDIKHPQNTGMQMNQVTMLYIPLRYVSAIEVAEGGAKLFDVKGSMTLSENPHIALDYRPNGANVLKVTVKDTSKSVWRHAFPTGSGS